MTIEIVNPSMSSAQISLIIAGVSAAGGGEVRFCPGNYDITDVALASRVIVNMTPGVEINPTCSTSTSDVFRGSGQTVGSAAALTVDSEIGGSTARISSTVGFSVGDFCILRDNNYLSPSSSGRNQEIARIIGVDPTVLHFERPLTSTFRTIFASEVIKLDALVNAHVVGDGIITLGDKSGGGIAVIMGYGCEIGDRVSINRPSTLPAFRLQLSTECRIRGGRAANGQDTASSGQGYGFELNESCTYCDVSGYTSVAVRENTITNRSRYNKVRDSRAINNHDDGFNTHGAACHFNEFSGLTVDGGGAGITIGWSAMLSADNDNTVRSCTIRNTSGYGVSLGGNPTKRQARNLVQGCNLFHCGDASIGVSYSDGCDAIGNMIDMGASRHYGVTFSSSNDAIIDGNCVRGDGVTPGCSGIRASDGSRVSMVHNSVTNIAISGGAVGYYTPLAGSDVQVVGNYHDRNVVSLVGVAVNKLNSWN